MKTESLRELIDLQQSALSLKKRAENIFAPEDKIIQELCEKIGYGAVMDSAARLWYLKSGGSCHTTYHCFSVVESVTKEALKELEDIENGKS